VFIFTFDKKEKKPAELQAFTYQSYLHLFAKD